MSVVDSTLPFSASFTEVIPPATKKSMNGTFGRYLPTADLGMCPSKPLFSTSPPGVQLKSTKKILLGTNMCIHDSNYPKTNWWETSKNLGLHL